METSYVTGLINSLSGTACSYPPRYPVRRGYLKLVAALSGEESAL